MEREEGSAARRPPRTASLLRIVQLTLVLRNSYVKIGENWRKEVFACSRSRPLRRDSVAAPLGLIQIKLIKTLEDGFIGFISNSSVVYGVKRMDYAGGGPGRQ